MAIVHSASTIRGSSTTTPLWQTALIAAVLAAAANAAIYGIARIFGTIPQSVMVSSPSGDGPLTLGSVSIMSIVAVLAATVLYAGIGRIASHPGRVLWFIGIPLLAVSL